MTYPALHIEYHYIVQSVFVRQDQVTIREAISSDQAAPKTEDTARIRRASASKKDTDPFNTQLFSNFSRGFKRIDIFAGGFKGIQMDSDKFIDNYCRNRGHCKDPQSQRIKEDTDPFLLNCCQTFSGEFKQMERDSDKCLSDSIGGNVEPSRGSF